MEMQLAVSGWAKFERLCEFTCLDAPVRAAEDAGIPEEVLQAFGNQDKDGGYREWWNFDSADKVHPAGKAVVFLKGFLQYF